MRRLGGFLSVAVVAAATGCTFGMSTVPREWNPDQRWSLERGEPDCEGGSGKAVASFVVGGVLALPSSYLGALILAYKLDGNGSDDVNTAAIITGAAFAAGVAGIIGGGVGLRNASRCRKAKRAFDCSAAHAQFARTTSPDQRHILSAVTPMWCFEPPYGRAPEPAWIEQPGLAPPGDAPVKAPIETPAAEPPAEPDDELPGADQPPGAGAPG